MTVLAASRKLSFKRTAIWHFFPPVTMLHVIEPQSFINLPVAVDILARPVRLVIAKVAHKHIAIRVVERSLPLSLAAHPHAYILRPIWPYLRSKTVLLLRLDTQLSAIHASIADLKVAHFLNPLHRLICGGKRRTINNPLYKIEVLRIRESRGARALQKLECLLTAVVVLAVLSGVWQSIRVADEHLERTRFLFHNAGVACGVVWLSDKLGAILHRIARILLVRGRRSTHLVGVDLGRRAPTTVSVHTLTRVTHCFFF